MSMSEHSSRAGHRVRHASAQTTAGLRHPALRRQQGAAIVIVMVVMLLGALLVAWSSRAALFSERVTGNEADYLLAFEAAQAMLADAELDALGITADGSACLQGCRKNNPGMLQVPQSFSLLDSDGGDFLVLERAVQGLAVPCRQGLCFDDGRLPARFWLDADTLEAMQASAALYGEFTGAVQDASMGNSRLLVTADMRQNRTLANAWYWIEPLEFNANSAIGQRYAPIGQSVGMNSINGIVYRITAVARGRKPGTQAIVQSILVPQAQAVIAARPSGG
ncbi:hypothetical protein E8K88_07565 [Lampropedia aestuarii]|uniref:Pilus assembly protein PilX n=1 Tax=Lampropedia aestuarii TaxID=2562762 RepID=A0A4S5BVF8_9BURK|nr:PilX N-terminal domain-containing pilus assembly protein [Lampropedia aestuarii]THJ33948.1 hypothetical protein E8K88_07565 [Lampropedia aestuarii]